MPIVTRLGSATADITAGNPGVFSDKGNALIQDDAVASFTTTQKNASAEFEISNFGFDAEIPSGATINSVTLRVRAASSTGGTHSYWIRVGSTDGSVNAPNAQSLTTNEHGTARPGGGDWTRDDLLNGTLTVRCRGQQPNNTTSRTYEFAWVEIEVDYSEPVGGVTGTLAATLGAMVLAAAVTVAPGPSYYLLESGGEDGILLEDGSGDVLLIEDNWVTLDDTLGASASSYSDTTVSGGTTYEYRVVAVNAHGETPSNIVSGTPLSSGATGALSQTLDALTSTSAGAVTVAGSSSPALDALTSTSDGAVLVTGSSSPTLDPLTSDASGSIGAATVDGTLSSTLGALTSTADGAVLVVGASSPTLGALTSTADGVVLVVGSSSATLGALTSDSSGSVGAVPIDGTLSVTLDALMLSAAEVTTQRASSSALASSTTIILASAGTDTWQTLDDTLASNASSYSDTTAVTGVTYEYRVLAVNAGGSTPSNVVSAAAINTGSLSATLGALTLHGVSSDWTTLDTLGGSAASYSDTTASAGTTYEYRVIAGNAQGSTTSNVVAAATLTTGTLSQTLGAITSSATGAVGSVPVEGTLSATLGALTSTSAGVVLVVGASSPTLGALTSSATGAVGSVPITASLDATLGALSSTSAGTVLVSGSLEATLGALQSASNAGVLVTGASSQTLGPVTLQSQAGAQITGTSAQTLGALTLSATAIEGVIFAPVESDLQPAGLGVFVQSTVGTGVAPTTVGGLDVTPSVGAGLGDVLRSVGAGIGSQPTVGTGVGVFPIADAGLSDVH